MNIIAETQEEEVKFKEIEVQTDIDQDAVERLLDSNHYVLPEKVQRKGLQDLDSFENRGAANVQMKVCCSVF